MSNKPLDKLNSRKLRGHPAVRAWNRLRSARIEPDSIVVLRETQKSHVYRLAGLGPGGAAVIAKRCMPETAGVERTIYEEILPQLPISALRYHGYIDEPDGKFSWLFIEDAGEERYLPTMAEHRVVAARWLARMHTLAPHIAAVARLPDRGPAFYLAHLRSACNVMRKLANPSLTAVDREVLAILVSLCELLESRWSLVEKWCGEMPRTLVHGDFREHNVRVRAGQDGLVVLPFDWEQAGQGVPAADLGQRLLRGFPNPDLPTYWSVARDIWPHLGMADLRRLAEMGKILRCLAAIGWAATCLKYKEIEKPMAKLRVYRTVIDLAMKAVGWLE